VLLARRLFARARCAVVRRRVDHVLTPAGRKALREADERADTRLRNVLADVPAELASDVLDALTRLHAALDTRLQEKLR
jgi:DNA-binding MarR family transcriptional regulator